MGATEGKHSLRAANSVHPLPIPNASHTPVSNYKKRSPPQPTASSIIWCPRIPSYLSKLHLSLSLLACRALSAITPIAYVNPTLTNPTLSTHFTAPLRLLRLRSR